jgi:hypothetical protein
MKTSINKLIFLSVIFAGTFITSCDEMWNHCTDGNGHSSSESRNLPAFSQIQVNGDFNVQVSTDTTSLVMVTTDENLQDLIKTYVSGDKLIIESKDGDCLNPSRAIEISVTTPAMNNIELNGSGEVHCSSLNADDLVLRLSGSGRIECSQAIAKSAKMVLEGSGKIECKADVEDLHSQIEGSGEIIITGSALNAEFRITGSGHQNGSQLTTDVCTTYIAGSGIIDTRVSKTLDVTIMGSGIVNYFGNPVITSYISGSGKIVKQ